MYMYMCIYIWTYLKHITVVIKKFLYLNKKYSQSSSPDHHTFAVLIPYFYRTTNEPLTILFFSD